MTTRTVLLSCALVFSSGVASGPRATQADDKPKVAPLTADLSGRWVYNRELSDDAREKMREGMEKGGGGGGRPPGGGGGGGTGGAGGQIVLIDLSLGSTSEKIGSAGVAGSAAVGAVGGAGGAGGACAVDL